MRDITGKAWFVTRGDKDVGVLWMDQGNEAGSITANGGSFLGAWGQITLNFAASRVVSTASENRPMSISLPMLISY